MELGGGLLLDAEDDGVGASDADGGVALADGFEGVLHLEEVAVRREHRDRSVVSRHLVLRSLLSIV